MAGELRYLAVCKRDVEPPIACGYDIRDVINVQAGFLECLSHNLVGKPAMLGAGWALDERKQIAGLVREHDLGHGGANVNTGEVQVDLLVSHYRLIVSMKASTLVLIGARAPVV
jgi:hypothetical protein